jgi:hypothetical protein
MTGQHTPDKWNLWTGYYTLPKDRRTAYQVLRNLLLQDEREISR